MIKLDKPFWVAIEKGTDVATGSYESSVLTGDVREDLLTELSVWQMNADDYELVQVKLVRTKGA